MYLSTVKQIWDDLEAWYSQNNVPRFFNLRKELTYLTQGTKSITTYFTQFRALIDELENLAHIPKCMYATSTCTCAITVELE